MLAWVSASGARQVSMPTCPGLGQRRSQPHTIPNQAHENKVLSCIHLHCVCGETDGLGAGCSDFTCQHSYCSLACTAKEWMCALCAKHIMPGFTPGIKSQQKHMHQWLGWQQKWMLFVWQILAPCQAAEPQRSMLRGSFAHFLDCPFHSPFTLHGCCFITTPSMRANKYTHSWRINPGSLHEPCPLNWLPSFPPRAWLVAMHGIVRACCTSTTASCYSGGTARPDESLPNVL